MSAWADAAGLAAIHRGLSVTGYNLGNLWPGRPLGRLLPKKINGWSLTNLQQRLLKHARY